MITIMINNIEWDLTEYDLAEAELPPTAFQIELSNEWIKDMIRNTFDTQDLIELIEDKYPFCFQEIDYEIEVS
jgi:hypothetical protein